MAQIVIIGQDREEVDSNFAQLIIVAAQGGVAVKQTSIGLIKHFGKTVHVVKACCRHYQLTGANSQHVVDKLTKSTGFWDKCPYCKD